MRYDKPYDGPFASIFGFDAEPSNDNPPMGGGGQSFSYDDSGRSPSDNGASMNDKSTFTDVQPKQAASVKSDATVGQADHGEEAKGNQNSFDGPMMDGGKKTAVAKPKVMNIPLPKAKAVPMPVKKTAPKAKPMKKAAKPAPKKAAKPVKKVIKKAAKKVTAKKVAKKTIKKAAKPAKKTLKKMPAKKAKPVKKAVKKAAKSVKKVIKKAAKPVKKVMKKAAPKKSAKKKSRR